MKLEIQYDAGTRTALVGRAGGAVLMKLTGVTRAQAERVVAGLGQYWRAADEKRGLAEGVYLWR